MVLPTWSRVLATLLTCGSALIFMLWWQTDSVPVLRVLDGAMNDGKANHTATQGDFLLGVGRADITG